MFRALFISRGLFFKRGIIMKKYICSAFIMLLMLVPSTVFAKNIAIYVDSVPLAMDVPPIVVQGRTLVPISVIGRSLNANVVWNEANRSISISKGSSIVRLSLDSKVAYVNDKMVLLEVPAQSVRGRTMVPLSFISTAFNETVRWDASGLAILIDSESPIRTLEKDELNDNHEMNIPRSSTREKGDKSDSHKISAQHADHINMIKDYVESNDLTNTNEFINLEFKDTVEINSETEKAP
jgi:hypothetical protein